MTGIKKLNKVEYHALATAGARALLVEMKHKELSLLDSFPELKETMEGFPKLRGKGKAMPSRAETALRLKWATNQPRLTPADLAKKFNISYGAASQALLKWERAKYVRRTAPGTYSGQKQLKAA